MMPERIGLYSISKTGSKRECEAHMVVCLANK